MKNTKKDVYEMVTARIIEKLENGVVPWRQPWINTNPVNWVTGKPYRGVNAWLLESGEYATFNQIKSAGGKVIKGAQAHMVVFWKWLEKEDEDTQEIVKIPFLRYYNVFEINTQVEGLQSKRKQTTFAHNPIEEAEKIVAGYQDAPVIMFAPGRAFYAPLADKISVPAISDYPNPNEYYSTMFHEMVHSTGHKARLNREGVARDQIAFGDELYSKEELIAEMGAAMLCGVAGIDNHTLEMNSSYIHSWLRKLKEDKKLIVTAAGQAQKASDFILGITHDS